MRRSTAFTVLWYGFGLLIGFAVSMELVDGWRVAKGMACAFGLVLMIIGGSGLSEGTEPE